MNRLLIVALAAIVVFSLGAECEAPTASPGVPAEIIIRYSATTARSIGFLAPEAGYIYLILDLDVENRGYESFSTGWGFYVVVDRVKYSTAGTLLLENSLKSVDLLDGGRVSGRVSFEVPQDVLSLDWEPRYEGIWDYNIKWIRQ